MEIRGTLKPDYVKCLNDNPTWTIPIINGIAERLQAIYLEDDFKTVTSLKKEINIDSEKLYNRNIK